MNGMYPERLFRTKRLLGAVKPYRHCPEFVAKHEYSKLTAHYARRAYPWVESLQVSLSV